MDFARLVSTTRGYNFHAHTQFCDGRATMEEILAAAVDSGMDCFGFTPHSPVPIESPCNMSMDDVSAYLAEIRRLQALYAGRVMLYAGMEVDYLGTQWGPAHPYFRNLGLDYTIGSVHFIESDCGYVDVDGRFDSFKVKMERYFANDIEHVVREFYRASLAMVEAGGFDVMGHLDKIGHNASHFRPGIEEERWYVRLADELVDAVTASGVAVEINTKAWAGHSGRLFPSRRLINRLMKAGAVLVVNSDVHHPSLVNSGRQAAFEFLGL